MLFSSLFPNIELLKGEEVVPLYAGFEPQTKAVFPLGTKENNYTMDVMVKVMDDFFFTTSTKFKIRVRVIDNHLVMSDISFVLSGKLSE